MLSKVSSSCVLIYMKFGVNMKLICIARNKNSIFCKGDLDLWQNWPKHNPMQAGVEWCEYYGDLGTWLSGLRRNTKRALHMSHFTTSLVWIWWARLQFISENKLSMFRNGDLDLCQNGLKLKLKQLSTYSYFTTCTEWVTKLNNVSLNAGNQISILSESDLDLWLNRLKIYPKQALYMFLLYTYFGVYTMNENEVNQRNTNFYF